MVSKLGIQKPIRVAGSVVRSGTYHNRPRDITGNDITEESAAQLYVLSIDTARGLTLPSPVSGLCRRISSMDGLLWVYVGTPEFAKWLVQTRLVYMSSCRGSSQDFVFNLCNHAIPAVTGFRWNIEDAIADEHSRRFYEELFRRRSIEDALYQTWNHMFAIDRKSKAWASSQLVMQLAA